MNGKQIVYRLGLLGAGLAVFAAVILLKSGGFWNLYHATLENWGVDLKFQPYIPFLDLEEYLASLECQRMGLDVFASDPCDILGRHHVYPVWLTPGLVPLDTADTNWAGILLGAGYVSAFAWMAKPRTLGETGIYLLALLSPASAFAVERGNMDLLVFMSLLLVVSLLGRKYIHRLAGYLIIFFLATLKFFPLVAMGAALRERPKRFLAVASLAAVAWAAFIFAARHQLRAMAGNYPEIRGDSVVFGGPTFFSVLQRSFSLRFPDHAGAISLASHGLYAAAVAASFAICALLVHGQRVPQVRGQATDGIDLQFIVGSFIVIGVFFAGINVAYKAIFLLPLLPLFLFARSQAPQSERRERNFWNVAIGMLIAMLWFPFLMNLVTKLAGSKIQTFAIILVREPVWWIFITFLMALLWARLMPIPVLGTLSFNPANWKTKPLFRG